MAYTSPRAVTRAALARLLGWHLEPRNRPDKCAAGQTDAHPSRTKKILIRLD